MAFALIDNMICESPFANLTRRWFSAADDKLTCIVDTWLTIYFARKFRTEAKLSIKPARQDVRHMFSARKVKWKKNSFAFEYNIEMAEFFPAQFDLLYLYSRYTLAFANSWTIDFSLPDLNRTQMSNETSSISLARFDRILRKFRGSLGNERWAITRK